MDEEFIQGVLRAVESEEGKKQFVISTATRDRHRTVLNMDNWGLKNYNNNPIVGYQHDVYGNDLCKSADPDYVIGHSKVWVENKELIAEPTFETADINPLADKIRKKVEFGTLRTTSVGFLPIGKGRYGEGEEAEGKSRETYYYEGQELLEWSIVNIPSNPDAVGRSIREQRAKVLVNVKRYLGKSYSDIENMRVAEVLDLIENRFSTNKQEEIKETFKGTPKSKMVLEMQLFDIK
ncbi:hypothetical protein [Chondrinema litorale]|uniref:hypothetical protein n=1 Tax=Chondrinema litorale TaxID=2994555 RepID=UPI0025433165|nr:hypothetical protein [Chondrinema litorale]UZS00260.1 hypothetical protein OQ292_40680 [Chondrinema litorale]